jgi:hypothetical protein
MFLDMLSRHEKLLNKIKLSIEPPLLQAILAYSCIYLILGGLQVQFHNVLTAFPWLLTWPHYEKEFNGEEGYNDDYAN